MRSHCFYKFNEKKKKMKFISDSKSLTNFFRMFLLLQKSTFLQLYCCIIVDTKKNLRIKRILITQIYIYIERGRDRYTDTAIEIERSLEHA